MNKRIITRVALTLLIMLTPLLTWAAEVGDVFVVDGLKYTVISESTVELTKHSGGKPTGDLIIPASVVYEENEYAVTSIGYQAFYSCTDLTSVVFPGSIRIIGVQAFQGCSGLTSITIPTSVIELSRRAFYKCSGLTSIVIPASVETIGEIAFYGCTSAESVIIGSGVTSIASDSFKNCYGVTDVYCYADPTKLSWDIAHTSNFSRDVWTKCHVFDATGWNDIVGPAVEIVGDLKVDLNNDIEAHYITLEDAKGCPAVFKREFQEDVSSTVCFPFSFTPSDGIGTFYEFTSVNSERTEVTMTTVATTPLQANKPYLFRPGSSGELEFEGTIDVQDVAAGKVNDGSGNWTFTGTYAERRWDAENNSGEIGRIYGFASGQGYEGTAASTEAGVFIRLNSGGIKPFRAYLEYTETQANARTRGSSNGLPEKMTVRLVDRTTGISTLETRTGNDIWYDVNGRKVNETKKGLFIKNGHKVVIK